MLPRFTAIFGLLVCVHSQDLSQDLSQVSLGADAFAIPSSVSTPLTYTASLSEPSFRVWLPTNQVGLAEEGMYLIKVLFYVPPLTF